MQRTMGASSSTDPAAPEAPSSSVSRKTIYAESSKANIGGEEGLGAEVVGSEELEGAEELKPEGGSSTAVRNTEGAEDTAKKRRHKSKPVFGKRRKIRAEPDQDNLPTPQSEDLECDSQRRNKVVCTDTGYCCLVCRAVFWNNGEPLMAKYCPCCGAGLVAGAVDGFSKMAKLTDAELSERMDKLTTKKVLRDIADMPRSKLERRKPLAPQTPDQSLVPGSEDRKTIKIQKTHSPFCHICGHLDTEIDCLTCEGSFHQRCMGLPPNLKAPRKGMMCYSCMGQKLPESEQLSALGPALSAAQPLHPLVNSKTYLPDIAQQCSSCGYHERESVNCSSCRRWFCFACMCLTLDHIKQHTFQCLECLGLESYDRLAGQRIGESKRKFELKRMGQKNEDGFAQLVYDLMCVCAWDHFDATIEVLIQRVKEQLKEKKLPFMLPFHSLHYPISKTLIHQISEAYARETIERALLGKGNKVVDESGNLLRELQTLWKQESLKVEPDGRLRIGYISSDFVDHPTADLIQSALLAHDTKKYKVFCYSITQDDKSEYRRTLSSEIEEWRNLKKSDTDRRCAEMIAEDGINILVNLNGHTAGDRNGISALRPAPVQMVYLAYPGTMGASFIDYNVVDSVVCPPEHRQYYSEKLLVVPNCYQANSFSDLYQELADPLAISPKPSRSAHQLPEKGFVFCNFCRLGRITRDLFGVWMRILQRVPGSFLWLYRHPTAAVFRLQQYAKHAGVDPKRLIFAPPCSPKIEHLKRVTLADLCLDTFVYNGHTTGSDMLWAGVPIVTLKGDNWPSLVGTCLNTAVGLCNMAVESMNEYEELAVAIATDAELAKAVRETLAHNRLKTPLFDSERWIRNFEQGLDIAWDRCISKMQLDSRSGQGSRSGQRGGSLNHKKAGSRVESSQTEGSKSQQNRHSPRPKAAGRRAECSQTETSAGAQSSKIEEQDHDELKHEKMLEESQPNKDTQRDSESGVESVRLQESNLELRISGGLTQEDIHIEDSGISASFKSLAKRHGCTEPRHKWGRSLGQELKRRSTIQQSVKSPACKPGKSPVSQAGTGCPGVQSDHGSPLQPTASHSLPNPSTHRPRKFRGHEGSDAGPSPASVETPPPGSSPVDVPVKGVDEAERFGVVSDTESVTGGGARRSVDATGQEKLEPSDRQRMRISADARVYHAGTAEAAQDAVDLRKSRKLRSRKIPFSA